MADTPTFGRYAEIPLDRMSPEQQEAYRLLIETRGRLPGPNKIWVENAKLAKVMGPLGAHFRTGYSLSERERACPAGGSSPADGVRRDDRRDLTARVGAAHETAPPLVHHDRQHVPLHPVRAELQPVTAGQELAPHAARPVPGSGDLCFLVDDLPAFYEELRTRGVTFVSPPVEVDTGITISGRVGSSSPSMTSGPLTKCIPMAPPSPPVTQPNWS